MSPLLEVRDLTAQFARDGVPATVVKGISFDIAPGEAVGFVGESGCGKSVTARAIMRLAPEGSSVAWGGRIGFRGQDLLTLSEREMRDIRGRRIAMVFQDPMASLNPVMSVGAQIDDILRRHTGLSRKAARQRTIELLGLVGIRDPAIRADDFPHQFSGGMRQRVLIAIAVSCQPDLLIADEPTTALDVTVQAQILDLVRQLRAAHGMAVLFITHDLGVVAEIADRVTVMYAGQVVETGTVRDVLKRPRHPYARALIAALPRIDRRGGQLPAIPGLVPDLRSTPPGCRFHPRCASAVEGLCDLRAPALEPVAPGVDVRCLRRAEIEASPR